MVGTTTKRVICASISTTELDIPYDIIRLDDDQLLKFMNYALPIEPDYDLKMMANARRDLISCRLSKTYAALKMYFGESSSHHHSWKGSFAYPFLILRNDQPDFRYVLIISHYRSGLTFAYYRISGELPAGEAQTQYIAPSQDFPRDEMSKILYYLLNWLTGYFSEREQSFRENFCKKSDSDLILFGYKDGQFFDRQYEDQALFAKEFRKIIQPL